MDEWTHVAITHDEGGTYTYYVDGAATNTHLEGAVPIVGAMVDSGAASLDGIELHGPASQWPAFKEIADSLGAKYFDVDASFAKFTM